MPASKSVLLPLLRREILPVPRGVGIASSSASTTTLPSATRSVHSGNARWAVAGRRSRAREGLLNRNATPLSLQSQRRAFSGTVRRGDEEAQKQQGGEEAEAAFDPSQIERESDEVDVCIVGGGKRAFNCSYLHLLYIYVLL